MVSHASKGSAAQATAGDQVGMTIAELSRFVHDASTAGVPGDAIVEVKVGIAGAVKEIWIRAAKPSMTVGRLLNGDVPVTVGEAVQRRQRATAQKESEHAASLARKAGRVPVKVAGRAVTGPAPDLVDVLRSHQIEDPRNPLEEQVEVPNEQHHTKEVRRVFAEAGLPITSRGSTLEGLRCILVPEPWNPHDSCAVAVLVGEHQIGHLPAQLAEAYQPHLLQLAGRGLLASGEARIWAKSEGGMVRARATLLIPEVHCFHG
ncbi:HIRAN domain-containing protein [Microlunatus sp. Y2014]|uniref:HIRAN domain-containing protein n=1 Tax=Microlunatus sp. Y2014 TaxID=3418488 RepID=UPI003DA79C42